MLWCLLAFSLPSLAAEEPAYVKAANERAQALYAPLLKPEESLRIEINPSRDESVAGSAARDTLASFRVTFDSGFVKSPRLTADAYRFALCHELGHLFGGTPHRHAPFEWDGLLGDDGRMLLSGEGQADYYASRACFRQLVSGENHAKALAGRKVPAPLRKACEGAWGKGDGALICLRTALGGYDFLRLVADFKISFDTKDSSVAPQTLDTYPDRQCRLDTALEGALCRDPSPLRLDGKDISSFGCRQGPGARPACWFRK